MRAGTQAAAGFVQTALPTERVPVAVPEERLAPEVLKLNRAASFYPGLKSLSQNTGDEPLRDLPQAGTRPA